MRGRVRRGPAGARTRPHGPAVLAALARVHLGRRGGGVRALFALPLQIGAIRIGVLDLYRDRVGDLDGDDLADALAFADAATLLLLAERRPDGPEWWTPTADDRRAVVYQATGMIMAQLGTSIHEAFVRLRARAFAEERPLGEIADDVVHRRMRFDESEE